MQVTSKITTKGQVVIPHAFRRQLNINPQDYISLILHNDQVIIQKAPQTQEMLGFVKTYQKLSDQQLEEAISAATSAGLGE